MEALTCVEIPSDESNEGSIFDDNDLSEHETNHEAFFQILGHSVVLKELSNASLSLVEAGIDGRFENDSYFHAEEIQFQHSRPAQVFGRFINQTYPP